jgi:hypothetical protein
MALMHGRARGARGRLTAQNGDFRPSSYDDECIPQCGVMIACIV